jgi:hypothetical protein
MSGPPEHSRGTNRGKVIRKVLLTTAIGGLTYFITKLAEQSQISAITLSAFLGGVALVVQFLSDFEIRLVGVEIGQGRQSTEVRQLVEEKFSAVSEATELFSRVEAAPLRDEVLGLVRNANRIGHPAPPLVLGLARSQVDRVSHLLQQLSAGMDAVYDDGEDRDWLLALTRNASSSIDATSWVSVDPDGRFVDEGLWLTELGQRYLEAQGGAAREGVVIRRVFILDRPTLTGEPLFQAIVDQQLSLGIAVRTIDLEKIRGVERALLSDLVLFDNAISYESTPGSRRAGMAPMFVKTTLVLEPDRVRQRIERFSVLWESASEIS